MSTLLLVGAGGLGCAAALALRGSAHQVRVLDDDVVDVTNLHRQVLFGPEDVGQPKAALAAARLRESGVDASPIAERFLPGTAAWLLEGVDLVLEGADNFATKFLVADAAAARGLPAVQAGAVGWGGWLLASRGHAADEACLRCIFEDVPSGPVASCESAGVVGPVVGLMGALQTREALRLLDGGAPSLFSFDGLGGKLRRLAAPSRAACPNHDAHAQPSGAALDPERYAPACRAT